MTNPKFCEIKIVEVGTLQKVLAVHPETGELHLNETFRDVQKAVERAVELQKYQRDIKDAIKKGTIEHESVAK